MTLLECLQHIRDHGACVRYGICGNVLYQVSNVDYERMKRLIERWPGGTGNKHHPIPDYFKEQEQGTLWDNPLRHELLNWLIEELEK